MPLSETTKLQRYLSTEFISKRKLQLPAVWLKPEGIVPSPEDAVADSISTDLDAWEDQNLGVRLVDGHFELKIAAPDDVWSGCLFEAFRHLRVDARAAYGVHHVSSILIRIEDPESIDPWRDRWPVGHSDKQGQKVKTQIVYSAAAMSRSKAIWRTSSPLPGSIMAGETVCWRPQGKPPAGLPELGLEDLEIVRELAATNMESICRAIAYATLLYWIRIYLDGLENWDESLTRVIGGWLAKIIPEGQAINARGKSLEAYCWAPIGDHGDAVQLLAFLQATTRATNQLGVEFLHAEGQLERNPSAHVPGWSSLEKSLGVQAKIGVRRAFKAGLDLTKIEEFADRYIYDETEAKYLDRESLIQGLRYDHNLEEVAHKWEPDATFNKNKRINPFRTYATSKLRVDVKQQEFFPGHEPGAILRFSPLHRIMDKDRDRQPDEYFVLNTFPGFKVKPIATIDKTLMTTAVSMLDRMLGLLTRDNDAQIKWLKQFIAHIAQKPEEKPQVCPIIIGGQGIGKSLFGQHLMTSLFDKMASTATASDLTDNKFLITPFINKLITFVDEVQLESPAVVNTIKKLVRQDYVSGQVKFNHQRDYYIPSRLLIASNQAEIGLSPTDAADRAFFFIMSVSAKQMGLTDPQFLEWSYTLKPFYNDFIQALQGVEFRQHLMRYFVDFEVTRAELEDLQYSSRNDEDIVRTMLSPTRKLARRMVAHACVRQHQDITAWFTREHVQDAIRREENSRFVKIDADAVMLEFENASVLESMRPGWYRFKYGYGKLLQKMGEAHNMRLDPLYDIKVGVDWGDNEVLSSEGGPPWRGASQKSGRDSADPRRPYNEDDHLD